MCLYLNIYVLIQRVILNSNNNNYVISNFSVYLEAIVCMIMI